MGNGVVFAPKFDAALVEMRPGLLKTCSIGTKGEVTYGDDVLAGRGLGIASGGTLNREESEHSVIACQYTARTLPPTPFKDSPPGQTGCGPASV